MKKHKYLGQVYTPRWIVDEILDLSGYSNSSILNAYILEPACGDGAFLVEIVRRYLDVALQNKLDIDKIIEGLEKYIYAVELDEEEFIKCLNNLNTLISDKLNYNKKINWNIFNNDTLLHYQNYINKFNYVIGNPPYIRIHNLSLEIRQKLKKEFLFSEGTIDIYLSFFEMGLKMLKKDGVLGFITPNSYLHNHSYHKFRNYLKTEKLLKYLIDFKANKVFKGYSTYTAITVLQKNNAKSNFDYFKWSESRISKINEISFSELNNKDWSFTSKKDELFLKELNENKNVTIKDYFDVQYGFATLRDKIFIASVKSFDNTLCYFNEHLIEKSILKKIIKGSKYKGTIDSNYKIIFPYEKVNNKFVAIEEEKLKTLFPYAYKYLLSNKKDLESRDMDKGAKWYEFGRSQAIQTIHNDKIILSTLTNGKIEYYKVPKDVMMYSGIFIIKNKLYSKWGIVEKILSSEDFFKYIRLTGKDFSGGYKSISSKQIKEFKVDVKHPEKFRTILL